MSTPTPMRFHGEIVYPPPGTKWFLYLKTGYRMKRTTYRRRVFVITPPIQVKEKSHERIPDVESKKDPEEDPQEDSEEEGELKKKRLKKASESDSNTWPLNDSTSDEEIDLELQSTARSEAKPKELEDTCESSV
ncbi:hypothetical protein Tco_0270757 [Tanacetum coccineum]